MTTNYIREYTASCNPGDTAIGVYVGSTYEENVTFSPIPTEAELNDIFNTVGLPLRIYTLFQDCSKMKAAPRLPDRAYLSHTSSSNGIFHSCSKLEIAPKLPTEMVGSYKSFIAAFRYCENLKQAPVIPKQAVRLDYMFEGATKLETPVSIPSAVTNTRYMFHNAANMTGEMVLRANPSTYTGMFNGTVKPITLYGDRTTCETLAATANNGNVSWSDWYDPVPAVTDRGQGSYTTADDITRMVRNGALAVNSYAPGRMVYHQGDIVREDEWIALVEAAQTIDPTITLSTNYANMNAIEAAFDSAL